MKTFSLAYVCVHLKFCVAGLCNEFKDESIGIQDTVTAYFPSMSSESVVVRYVYKHRL